jgi:hypothetical protein
MEKIDIVILLLVILIALTLFKPMQEKFTEPISCGDCPVLHKCDFNTGKCNKIYEDSLPPA